MFTPIKPFSQAWRDMAHVPRWVILRKNRQQHLAEHSYFVALYADQVARLIDWHGSYTKLFRYALYHDIDETVTGDVPGPAKRAAWDKERAEERIEQVMRDKYGDDVMDARSSVTDEIKAIVAVADALEEVCYLTEEMLSGNRWVSTVRVEAAERLEHRWAKLPADPDFLDRIWDDYIHMLIVNQEAPPVLLKDIV
jgi:5'-deoxynucleotidase YfbR-like HD superfamily hydrolase